MVVQCLPVGMWITGISTLQRYMLVMRIKILIHVRGTVDSA